MSVAADDERDKPPLRGPSDHPRPCVLRPEPDRRNPIESLGASDDDLRLTCRADGREAPVGRHDGTGEEPTEPETGRTRQQRVRLELDETGRAALVGCDGEGFSNARLPGHGSGCQKESLLLLLLLSPPPPLGAVALLELLAASAPARVVAADLLVVR